MVNHFGGLGGYEEKGVSSSPWCIFDDSQVTTCVVESEVAVSNAAYCLYYKRKDVVFDDDDYVVEDNETIMRMSKTTTPTKQQFGVNSPHSYEGREGGRSMKSEGGLVSMPVSPMHTTPRSSPQPSDANTNDAAMGEAESCSSAASYVTSNTSLQAELDVYDEMNDLI